MPFEATLEEGDILCKIVSAIGDLVQDANFDVSDEGIRLQAMDSSHVSLVNLFLSAESFANFQCDSSTTLGVNFQSLSKVLGCSKSKDRITLRCDDDDADKLQLIFTSPDDNRTLHFELKLMEIDAERLIIPETEYKSVIRMSSKEFKSLCSGFGSIGDSLGIACTKEAVKFHLTGDIGNGDMLYKHNDELEDFDKDSNSALIRCEEAISQNFAIRYLTFFAKATPLAKCVTLFMSADVPLVTEFKIDDIGHLKYYLAPKIEDDE